jgi:two-component sensor histidine kinase
MSEQVWPEQALPVLGPDAVLVFTAELAKVSDLTDARGRLDDELQDCDLPVDVQDEDIERLLLAFEELTSNALRHGTSPVRVTVTATTTGWLIDVTDTAHDQAPLPAVDRDPSHGGLGLYLVAQLSAGHGWTVERNHKHVWACVRRAALSWDEHATAWGVGPG